MTSGPWRTDRPGRRLAADSALALALGAVTVAVPHPDAVPGSPPPAAAVWLAGLACFVLVLRRLTPRVTLLLSTLGTAAALVVAGDGPMFTFGVAIALYSVAAHTDRRTTVVALVGCLLMVVAAVALVLPSPGVRSFLNAASGLVAFGVVAAAVGDAVRSRRTYLAAVEERAVRAEQSREEEARRRVAEERLRIARELHDVVAHHVAVVSVQAGVANHLLIDRPQAAQDALRHVQQASAAILDELAGILGVLRTVDEVHPADAPAPGLDQLPDLVTSYVDTGLAVGLSITGRSRELSGTAELVAYRIVEEGLTNAYKHGTGTATVTVAYRPDAVVLEVVNPVRVPARQQGRAGHGLLGMRERAAAVGADLQIGADGDTFGVRLTLPAPAPAAAPENDRAEHFSLR